jgi:hypothetical protein
MTDVEESEGASQEASDNTTPDATNRANAKNRRFIDCVD